MSRTFKLSIIFLVTVALLMIFRIVFAYIDLSDNIHSWLFSFLYQVFALGLTPYLMYTLMFKSKPLEYIETVKIKVKINPLTYVLAILVGLMVFYLNTVISSFNYLFLNAFGYTYTNSVSTIFSSPEVLIFEIITTAMLPAVFEEIVDRGLLLGILNDVKNQRFKMIIIGITFGLLHQNVAQFSSTVFAGLILGYLAIHTGSIIPSVIVHFINNFFIVMLNYSSQNNGWFDSLYTDIYSFSFSNVIYLFVMVAAASVMLSVLLKQVRRINVINVIRLEIPIEKNTNSQPKSSDFDAVYEIMKAANSNEDDDFNYIYSQDRKEDDYNRKEFDEQISSLNKSAVDDIKLLNVILKSKAASVGFEDDESIKMPFKDFVLFYLSLVMAALTTVFTFIWGFIR